MRLTGVHSQVLDDAGHFLLGLLVRLEVALQQLGHDVAELLVGLDPAQHVLPDCAVVAEDVLLRSADRRSQGLDGRLQRQEHAVLVVIESVQDVGDAGGLGAPVALQDLLEEHAQGDDSVLVVSFGLADGADEAPLGTPRLDADQIEELPLVSHRLVAGQVLHAFARPLAYLRIHIAMTLSK